MKAAVLMTRATGDTDLELVELHRYGDPAAFEEIYRRHAEMVFNVALRMTGDVEEAADVALYLASDESSYVNGSVITLDGGRTGLTPGTF